MPTLDLATDIAAPPERVFDLARCIDLHMASTAHTGERAVAGVTSGLIGMGQEVTWEARHLGVRQRLSVRITLYDRPRMFVDRMVKGAFAHMEHHHHFAPLPDGGTRMRDVFVYASPLGPLGLLADALFLKRHLRNLLLRRNAMLKAVAESPEEWKRHV